MEWRMITQADSLTSGVIETISHPLTVQILNQGPGIWGNVATGLITGGAAIAAVMLTHKFTPRRERSASEDKQKQERYFIATELVFLLEQFAEGCADVTKDFDYTSGDKSPQISSPVLDYAVVTGDWHALPHPLMYSIRELAVLHKEADRSVAASAGKDNSFHHYETVRERHYQYARLGIKAVIVARRLRKWLVFPTPDWTPCPGQHNGYSGKSGGMKDTDGQSRPFCGDRNWPELRLRTR